MASRDAPVLQAVYLVLLAALLVGVTLQVRWLRKVMHGPIGERFPGKAEEFEGTRAPTDVTRRK